MKFLNTILSLFLSLSLISSQFTPQNYHGNNRVYGGGLVGGILGAVFGGGQNGASVGYGNSGGLVQNVLGGVFGNGCNNGGVLGSVLGTGGNGQYSGCYGGYIVLTPTYPGSIRYLNFQGYGALQVSGLPRTYDAPQGILQIVGDARAFYVAPDNYHYYINTDFVFQFYYY